MSSLNISISVYMFIFTVGKTMTSTAKPFALCKTSTKIKYPNESRRISATCWIDHNKYTLIGGTDWTGVFLFSTARSFGHIHIFKRTTAQCFPLSTVIVLRLLEIFTTLQLCSSILFWCRTKVKNRIPSIKTQTDAGSYETPTHAHIHARTHTYKVHAGWNDCEDIRPTLWEPIKNQNTLEARDTTVSRRTNIETL